MKISDAGLKAITAHEGFRANAYPDPGSSDGTPWTIGYGHTRGVKKGDKISKALALTFLRSDIAWAENAVNKGLKRAATQNQFDAFVSFTFNIGANGFARSSALRAHNAGDYNLVPSKLALWNKNDGKVLKGLVNRRAAEGAMYASNLTEKTPQRPTVDVSKGKPMEKSKTAWTAGGQLMAGVAMITGYAREIKDNIALMLDGQEFNHAWVFGGMLFAGTILTACWFIYDRHNKSAEDGV